MSTDVETRRAGAPAGWNELELSVRRLLDAHDSWRRRAVAAEARIAELEASLGKVSRGEFDPEELAAELRRQRARNRDLAARMDEAREAVRRIGARLRFLEDDG